MLEALQTKVVIYNPFLIDDYCYTYKNIELKVDTWK